MRQPQRAIVSLSLLSISLALAVATSCATARAQTAASYDELAKREAAANAEDGKRVAPLKSIGNPTADVSAEMQAMIGAPYPPHFNADPKTPAEWKELIDRRAKLLIAGIPALKAKLGVKVEETRLAGVHCYIVTPNKIALENRRRLLIHVHGGGYVFGPGEAALPEAIMMAGFGGYKVISVDYRMPPDFPYPAAMDDAMAVWKEVLKSHEHRRLAIFGTSTGGAMTLAMVLRARDEKLPLPAAIAPGTPWSDIDKIGDSYASNEWVDNVLVTWDGWLGRAAKLYANGTSLKNPYISPIYGDFKGFPPTILTSGTRDLFLSNTVRTHRKLRRAGVIADLNVYEGQSHAQYQFNVDAPETKEAFTDIARFFDRYLKQ
ncbi:monoterpene epsilon-lactone hydrolase [Bradyrhizobium japonicum]|uniref:Monoterpene epsilon-lactone hydrolase n=2 Tax=Bacteria TaxID=2 RepID=A0ABV4FFL6_BRAEL|nr:alpha/beta hydrolase [Bradyrhizobium elkanii]MBP2430617.1 acetyl esterase/lipase [Bradyrhizobium elkanii]MCP1736043.1 acetyl esterase/lipase [Bradyrhizobium elkanii]MCP1753841.1 acetyl esterase/lipase [Bradyrhizobium elkanii]MCP1979361.1 acetyl esterase/lipase [Bradyrhizobium elkanii]MCS3571384.1 acetyl esterase/lipase [Bradyrhizobium elkanii]